MVYLNEYPDFDCGGEFNIFSLSEREDFFSNTAEICWREFAGREDTFLPKKRKKPDVPPHDAKKARHWTHNKVKVFDFAAEIMLDLSYFLEFLRNFSLMKYQKFPGGFARGPRILL